MKVLMLHGSYSDTGGAEIVVTQQAHRLAERGHEVLVFCYGNQSINQKNLIVIKEPTFIFFRYTAKLLVHGRGYRKLKKVIKSFRPDIIHLNNIDKYALTFLLPAKDYKTFRSIHDYGIVCPLAWGIHRDDLKICDQGIGVKCIRHGCIMPLLYPFRYYLFKTKNYFQKKRINAYLAATEKLKHFMMEQGFKNISVSPYFSVLYGSPSFTYHAKKILFVGALEKHKGCELLINAFKIAVQDIPELTLVIAGSGTQEPKLRSLCRSANLESKIHFVGAILHNEINACYAEAAIVVVPSLSMENSPLVIYEAFSLGKPVIATNRGGNAELVKSGYNGFLVGADNPQEMARAIADILDKNNAVIYQSLAKNAFASAKLYNVDKYIDKLEEIYAAL